MALTNYGVPATTTLSGNLVYPTPPPIYTVTGFSYTNPNITMTLSTTHNFQVGNTVNISGVVVNSTQGVYATVTLTAVGSNTITWNYGVTAPGAYVSGGTVQLFTNGNINGAKIFSNGVAVCSTNQGSYYYTTDNVNWTAAQLPTQTTITAMEYDGVNYIFGAATAGIYTSSTLAIGSWTQRSTFGGFYVNSIKWCAGNVNRVVAVGSGDTSYNGTTARIEVATQGGTSWTNQTISGTNGSAATEFAFDGNSTIVAVTGAGPTVSTSGAGSWVAYTTAATWSPNNVANQAGLYPTFSFPHIVYNSATSRWVGFSVGLGYITGHASASNPAVVWTRSAYQTMPFSYPFTATSGYYTTNISNPVTFDSTKNLMYAWNVTGGDVKIWAYNANPTFPSTGGTAAELYQVAAVYTASIGLTPVVLNTASAVRTWYPVAAYGNNKWVLGISSTNATNGPHNMLLGIYQ